MHVGSRALRRSRTRELAVVCSVAVAVVMGISGGVAWAASPGSIDTSFGKSGIAGAGSNSRLFGTAVQSDGKVLAVGETGVQSGATLLLARFGTTGALDRSFGSGGLVRGPAIATPLGTGSIGRAVAVQPNGKIVVVGTATDAQGSASDGILVERYNANGSLDGTFAKGGAVTTLTAQLGAGYGVAIQRDGKIVAAGSANAAGSGGVAPRVAVLRFNANGAPDSSFGSNGTEVVDFGAYSTALAVALQPDGKIVISGSQSPSFQAVNALLARFTSSGHPDSSFASGGAFAHQYAQGAASSAFNSLAIQSNGRIVAAGAATQGNAGANTLIVRFTSGGAQDGSFGSGGVVNTPSAVNTSVSRVIPGATGVGIAGNGDIIAGGTTSNAGLTHIAVWAFKSNGTADTGFGSHGTTTTSLGSTTAGEGQALAIGPDGRIALAGDSKSITGTYSAVVARYIGFTPALKASLKGVSRSYKASSVAAHGLKIGVNCNQACTIKVSLTVSGSKSAIASGKATLRQPGTSSIRLKLSRALGKRKSVALSLQVSVTSTLTHKRQTIKSKVTLKR